MELAHEAWFTDARPDYRWDFLLEPLTVAAVGSAILAVVLWRLMGSRLPRPELGFLAFLERLVPYVPRLLAVHAGVSLIAQAYGGTYLAPSLDLPDTPAGAALAVAEGVLGVWLVSGWKVRPAAVLLALSGPLGMVAYGVVPILERVDLLGIALFLSRVPPGPDRYGAIHVDPERLRTPVWWLKGLAGASLVVLAFTEKLARPDLALELLDRYPVLNVARAVGWQVPDLVFVTLAGAVELAFGLLLISGALPQLVVLAAGVPFNATLFFFGAEELVGHLPLYGTMLALLVYGSSPVHAPVVAWLPGRREGVGSTPPP